MPRGGIRSTSFRPGTSGNPTGRPKRVATIEARRVLTDVRAAAREYGQDALDVLVEIMKDPKATKQARINAAQVVLDRGFGRPLPPQESPSAAYDLTRLSDTELEILDRILERATPPILVLEGHPAD